MVRTGRHPSRIKRSLHRSYGVLTRTKFVDGLHDELDYEISGKNGPVRCQHLMIDHNGSKWANNVVRWMEYKVY